MKNWLLFTDNLPSGHKKISAIPNNDLHAHYTDCYCKCNPREETMPNGNLVVIHNSYDGREFEERFLDSLKYRTP